MTSVTVVLLDDDALLLKALQRTIIRTFPNTIVLVANELDEFWQLLQDNPDVDLVISDYLMPHMNGLDVLELCVARYPYPVRALLTGDMTNTTIMRQPNLVHAYLSKPFSGADISNLLNNVAELKSLPFEKHVRRQLGAMMSFPVCPIFLQKLQIVLSSDDYNLHQITTIVSQEPVITAKLLQIANSAYLGFQRQTSSIDEAVSRIGSTMLLAIVTSLAMSQAVGNVLPTRVHERQLEIASNYAGCVKTFAEHAGFNRKNQELLFSVAILSFVGKVILLCGDQSLAQSYDEGINTDDLAHYQSVSAYVMKLWGYDSRICTLLMSCNDLNGIKEAKLNEINQLLYIVRKILFSACSVDKLQVLLTDKNVDINLTQALASFDWKTYLISY
ncbi:HDOD domain-containing protein [Pseudoalteromonas sp. SR41-8]|jgi:HD-like signal output (HDOD) protein|uniref:HDOD domain-containing protein n=1 Tax=Pseudoalteromonas sp. SR41-8 TaxID=2760946 RepID=UPI001600F0F6|nr:HDOD domain-containing protein [Pseudoalteromonas sp. SR41-8]MBB1307883.1 HDOD domain-containing protein [Pseudoalteromonas sp. SR41-8]